MSRLNDDYLDALKYAFKPPPSQVRMTMGRQLEADIKKDIEDLKKIPPCREKQEVINRSVAMWKDRIREVDQELKNRGL